MYCIGDCVQIHLHSHTLAQSERNLNRGLKYTIFVKVKYFQFKNQLLRNVLAHVPIDVENPNPVELLKSHVAGSSSSSLLGLSFIRTSLS